MPKVIVGEPAGTSRRHFGRSNKDTRRTVPDFPAQSRYLFEHYVVDRVVDIPHLPETITTNTSPVGEQSRPLVHLSESTSQPEASDTGTSRHHDNASWS